MKITKDDVLEALETEPLGWNGWIRFYDEDSLYDEYSSCTVCAVGAVLKHSGVPPWRIRTEATNLRSGSIRPDLYASPRHRKSGNWISALSNVWESLDKFNDQSVSVEEARVHMMDWVEENVPDDIDLITGEPI